MDDFFGIIVIVFLAAAIALVAIVGIVALIAAAAIVGVGYLTFLIGKVIIKEVQGAMAENERKRLEAAQAEQAVARQLKENTEAQERGAKLLAEEQTRQLEAERQRRQFEEALSAWKHQWQSRKPEAQKLADSVVEYSGRKLYAVAVVDQTGVTLEWHLNTVLPKVPQVVGICDRQEMFREWAIAGKHRARLAEGRFLLIFRVSQDQATPEETDLAFEIFVPGAKAKQGLEYFHEAVIAKTQELVSRAKAIMEAKRTVTEALTAEGSDAEEITLELCKLESAINELEQKKE